MDPNINYNRILNEGIIAAKQGKIQEAERKFKNAISINNKKSDAFINLSNLYIIDNNIKNATNLLFQFLEKNLINIDVANHLGKICSNYKKKGLNS